MKKLLLIGLLSVATLANAQHHHHGYHHGGYNNWVAPLIVGGVVTYALTRPQPVIVQQPTVVQTYPQAPYGFHYENILDANCNCYRLVLVQN